jgi:hypothetical protein
MLFEVLAIVIRPDLGVDPVKEPDPGLHELIRVNLDQLEST